MSHTARSGTARCVASAELGWTRSRPAPRSVAWLAVGGMAAGQAVSGKPDRIKASDRQARLCAANSRGSDAPMSLTSPFGQPSPSNSLYQPRTH